MTLYYTWMCISKITSHQRFTYAVSAFIENEDETQFVNAAKNENFDEIAEYINSENTSRKNENNTLGQEKYEYFE